MKAEGCFADGQMTEQTLKNENHLLICSILSGHALFSIVKSQKSKSTHSLKSQTDTYTMV